MHQGSMTTWTARYVGHCRLRFVVERLQALGLYQLEVVTVTMRQRVGPGLYQPLRNINSDRSPVSHRPVRDGTGARQAH